MSVIHLSQDIFLICLALKISRELTLVRRICVTWHRRWTQAHQHCRSKHHGGTDPPQRHGRCGTPRQRQCFRVRAVSAPVKLHGEVACAWKPFGRHVLHERIDNRATLKNSYACMVALGPCSRTNLATCNCCCQHFDSASLQPPQVFSHLIVYCPE